MSSHLEVPSPRAYRFSERTMSRKLDNEGGVYYTGIENIPDASQPYIIAPVHRNWRDIIAVARVWLDQRDTSVHFVTAADMLQKPKVKYSGLGYI